MIPTRKCGDDTTMNKARVLGQTEFDFLAVADIGNGLCNAVSVKGDGSCRASTYSASTRVLISPIKLQSPEIQSMMQKFDLYTWNGQTYAFGDDVAMFRREQIERNYGNRRYGEDAHQFMVAASLLNMGVAGDVDLTLFIPPGRFNEMKDSVIKAFMGKTVHIAVATRHGMDFEATLTYKNVRVLPEGVGVVFCNRYRPDGSPDDTLLKYLNGEIGIIDFGRNTVDFWIMVNGMFDPTAIKSVDDFGVQHEIIEPILRALTELNRDYAYILPEEIDAAIRDGSFKFTAPNGQIVNFKKTYDKLQIAYADRVSTEVIQPHMRSLEGMGGAHLLGGGAIGIRQHLAAKYRGKIFSLDAVGNVHETEINAEGALRFVLFNYFHKMNG